MDEGRDLEASASASGVNEKSPGKEKDRLSALSLWVGILSSGLVVSSFVFLISYLNPIKSSDLTIWIKRAISIDLPSNLSTNPQPIPLALTYKGETIKRATLMEVSITNFGTNPVGGKDPWVLTLKTNDNSRIVLLPTLRLYPNNLDFKVLDSASSAVCRIQMGILRPDEYAEFQIININPSNTDHPDISSEASRVPEVPQPMISRQSLEERVHDRVAKRFELPAAIVTLLLSPLLGWRLRKKSGFWSVLDWKSFLGLCIALLIVVAACSMLLQQIVMWKLTAR